MKELYYFIGILFILYELKWILNTRELSSKHLKALELSKEFKDLNGDSRKWEDLPRELKDLLQTYILPNLIFLLWMFIGLFTFNWFAFLIIILFNITFVHSLAKFYKNNLDLYTLIHKINSIIGFVFGIFVIVNTYHLKINLVEYFTNLLN